MPWECLCHSLFRTFKSPLKRFAVNKTEIVLGGNLAAFLKTQVLQACLTAFYFEHLY